MISPKKTTSLTSQFFKEVRTNILVRTKQYILNYVYGVLPLTKTNKYIEMTVPKIQKPHFRALNNEMVQEIFLLLDFSSQNGIRSKEGL